MRLNHKVALITGVGSGIGRESALLFAREGAQIVGVDLNPETGEKTRQDIVQAGGQAIFIQADVSRPSDAMRMVEAAEESFGRLDILFNNAGISHAQDDDAIHTPE
ncbi:SDR family NAD(P)-dependent oxidoreductase, partial [Allomeiothermus silvanus]|uniref:SDR family NAD(P)-dependent oxidoreductase n=1 Tax=Allomeiothermus silvanus TaxID=52022 RepID=UPI0023F4F7A5